MLSGLWEEEGSPASRVAGGSGRMTVAIGFIHLHI